MKNTKLFSDLKQNHWVYSVEYAYGGTWPPKATTAYGDIRNFAGNLNSEIDWVKLTTGARKVDLVTHSMGGLVSRWAIQQLHRTDVKRLIMIAPPNHGSDLARFSHTLPIFAKWTLQYFLMKNPALKDEADEMGDAFEGILNQGLSNSALYEMTPHSPFLQQLNGNNDCDMTIALTGGSGDDVRYGYYVIGSTQYPTLTHIHLPVEVFNPITFKKVVINEPPAISSRRWCCPLLQHEIDRYTNQCISRISFFRNQFAGCC